MSILGTLHPEDGTTILLRDINNHLLDNTVL